MVIVLFAQCVAVCGIFSIEMCMTLTTHRISNGQMNLPLPNRMYSISILTFKKEVKVMSYNVAIMLLDVSI